MMITMTTLLAAAKLVRVTLQTLQPLLWRPQALPRATAASAAAWTHRQLRG